MVSAKNWECDPSDKQVVSKGELKFSILVGICVLLVLVNNSYGEAIGGTQMSDLCESIVKNTALIVNVDKGDAPKMHVTFTNRNDVPLWVPQEKEPAYRVDKHSRSIVISYGYFEEVYGPYRGRYMLPPMEVVQPNQEYRWEICNSTLIREVFDGGLRTHIQMRIALRTFTENNVRGAQELDAYIKESCVIKSLEFKMEPK